MKLIFNMYIKREDMGKEEAKKLAIETGIAIQDFQMKYPVEFEGVEFED